MKRYLLFFLPLLFLVYLAPAQNFNEIQTLYKDAKNKGQDSLTAVYAMQLGNEAWALNIKRRRVVVKFESVEFYYKESIKYAELSNDTILQAKGYINLARLYGIRAAKKRDVVPTLGRARTLYLAKSDTLGYAEVQYKVAKAQIINRNYSRAAVAMTEAMDNYELGKNYDKAQDCARDLVDIYRWLGNANKSEFYEEEAVRLSSSSRELAQRDLLIQRAQDSLEIQQKDIALKEEEVARQKAEADKQRAEVKQQRTFLIYSILVAVLILVFLALALRVQRKIRNQKKEVEKLLLNILPKKTAEELRIAGAATPQSYARVSVIFTDFKGFTQVSEKMTPEEIIEELGICFSSFDEIVEKNHLEKIKTIGDAYMCAGGVPEPNQSNPVEAVRAALAMQAFMAKRIEENRLHGRPILELRIGIHTGPVVAGVVGKKKFAYDIWGDAVNIAARMESSGEPNRVNISGETYSLIKDQFVCTHRGKIPAKNKGEIDMYFVEGEK